MDGTIDDPTDALAVLGDETRMAILRALAEADDPLPFSRLRDRADVRDSGRFAYHLRKLCEYFVRESDEGYELGHAGSRVIAAAGGAASETASPAGLDDVDPANAVDECPVCGDEGCEKLFHVHLTPSWREG